MTQVANARTPAYGTIVVQGGKVRTFGLSRNAADDITLLHAGLTAINPITGEDELICFARYYHSVLVKQFMSEQPSNPDASSRLMQAKLRARDAINALYMEPLQLTRSRIKGSTLFSQTFIQQSWLLFCLMDTRRTLLQMFS